MARFRAIIHEQLPEAEEVVMTIAEQLREEGRKQGLQRGLQQGLEQGRRNGLVAMLERQLTRKFGEWPPSTGRGWSRRARSSSSAAWIGS